MAITQIILWVDSRIITGVVRNNHAAEAYQAKASDDIVHGKVINMISLFGIDSNATSGTSNRTGHA